MNKKTKKPSNLPAAVIVATATQPPPKAKEIIAALCARERVRLESVVAKAKADLEAAKELTEAAAAMWVASMIPQDIDAMMAVAYGPRTKTTPNLERVYDWNQKDDTKRAHYITLSYGTQGERHSDSRALLRTGAAFPNASPEGKRWAEATAAEAKAEAARDACRIRSTRGDLDDHERWIRAQLAAFRAKAEGSRTVKDHPDRVAALLANPETVQALDSLRDQINSPKADTKPVALLPEPVTV